MDSNLKTLSSLNGIKGTIITHLNIRSLPLHGDLYRQFLIDHEPHVSTLSETWLHDDIPSSMLTFHGYKMYRMDRPSISD